MLYRRSAAEGRNPYCKRAPPLIALCAELTLQSWLHLQLPFNGLGENKQPERCWLQHPSTLRGRPGKRALAWAGWSGWLERFSLLHGI